MPNAACKHKLDAYGVIAVDVDVACKSYNNKGWIRIQKQKNTK
jgi:hypothetical protein